MTGILDCFTFAFSTLLSETASKHRKTHKILGEKSLITVWIGKTEKQFVSKKVNPLREKTLSRKLCKFRYKIPGQNTHINPMKLNIHPIREKVYLYNYEFLNTSLGN